MRGSGRGVQRRSFMTFQFSERLDLPNTADEVVLEDAGGTDVDRVAYTATWPNAAGRAIGLTSTSADNPVATSGAFATVRGGSYQAGAADLGMLRSFAHPSPIDTMDG